VLGEVVLHRDQQAALIGAGRAQMLSHGTDS
jgi:hypothetical protein